jgi:hypothetical protein
MGQSAAESAVAQRKKMQKRVMAGLHYGMTFPRYCRTFVTLSFLTSATLWACQVPVFRYALERWEPGQYVMRMPDAAKRDLVAVSVNVTVETGAAQLELFYPRKLRQSSDQPIWSAPPTEANVKRVLESPVRTELRQRLLAGESAIWVLLECGHAEKDEAAAKTLEGALKAAEAELELPEGVITQEEAANPNSVRKKENADVLQSDLPLKIAFSMLRVSRSDEAEAALIAMLTHIEPDLVDLAEEPMVFPVFGRGRALEPLIGKGIHADNVLEAATYLCGACSCEIKEQNPGIDLLMTADWAPVDNAPKIETVQIVPTAANAPQVEGTPMWMGIAAGVLVMAALLLMKRR